MLKNLLEQNITHIIWAITIVVLVLILFKIWKFYRITDLDKNYKKTDLQGNVIQNCRTRNIWDYHFFPGLSRMWHSSEWQEAAGITLLLIFLGAYLYTRDQSILFVLGVNFGVVFGMQIQRSLKRGG